MACILWAAILLQREKFYARCGNGFCGLRQLLAFLLNTAGQRFLYSHGFYKTNGLYWYSDAAIFLMGLILFELLRRHVSGRKVPGSGD